MQDLLTLAATATLFGTIGFIALGYPLYVWHRTAPFPASEFLTKEELAEEGNAEIIALAAQVDAAIATPTVVEPEAPASLPELFAAVDAIMSNPIYAADAPATPVKRYRKAKASQPAQEVIEPTKRKRGRPRKDAAA